MQEENTKTCISISWHSQKLVTFWNICKALF